MPNTILVVEDELPNIETMQRLLESQRFDVRVATNKTQACETVSTGGIDLILMDMRIPVAEGQPVTIAGLDAINEIKADPRTSEIPVIAMTASVMPDDLKRFREAGCVDVQHKPFDFAELIACIKQHLPEN